MPYPVRFNCSIAFPCTAAAAAAAAAAACNNGLSIRRSRSSDDLNVLRINSISRPYRLLYKCSFGGGGGGGGADDDDDNDAPLDDGDINEFGGRVDAANKSALRLATAAAAAAALRCSSSMP